MFNLQYSDQYCWHHCIVHFVSGFASNACEKKQKYIIFSTMNMPYLLFSIPKQNWNTIGLQT